MAGGTTRIFHYDLRGHLIAETDQNQQMVAEYVYLGDQLLAMIKPGELVYYFHNDHLGTPQVLTDDTGAIAWKAVYTPFGEAVASIQTVDNPFRFPGQYYDSETGLHYNYFRYYNPQTGRYITPDPIGLEGGVNLFVYAESNVVNYKDVLGLWREAGHRDLTLIATKPFSNFFTPVDIQRLVAANAGVDITNPFENPAHFMPGTKEAAESIIRSAMKNAIELELLGSHDAAMYFLGSGLHTLQDRYSHYEQNAGWGEHSIRTLGPDDPAVHINEYTRAAIASREYIKRFIEEIKKREGIICR